MSLPVWKQEKNNLFLTFLRNSVADAEFLENSASVLYVCNRCNLSTIRYCVSVTCRERVKLILVNKKEVLNFSRFVSL